MRWDKKQIKLEDIPELNKYLNASCKTGQPFVENMRGVFKKKDAPVMYMYTVFDWLDNQIDVSQLEYCYLYQPFNEN